MIKVLAFILLFLPIIDFSSHQISFPRIVEKRVAKRLDKFFEKEEYIKTPYHIPDSLAEKSNSYYYLVKSKQGNKVVIMVITIANGCRVGGCDVEHKEDEEFEQFYLYSLFTLTGELIDIKILDYQGEYGYEVTSKWWLRQFKKNWSQHFEYGKNIDAISGATISVKSMIREMTMLQEIIIPISKQKP